MEEGSVKNTSTQIRAETGTRVVALLLCSSVVGGVARHNTYLCLALEL